MNEGRGYLRLAGSALAGAVGWSGRYEWLPFAALVLLLWRLSRSRTEASLSALLYYAAASASFIPATARFFGGTTEAVLLWALSALLLSLPWTLLWSPRLHMSAGARLLRGGGLLHTLMLPPLGVISFVNPFVAGAALLPGLGLLAFLILTFCVFAPSTSTWPLWATGFSLLCAFACDSHQHAEAPAEWAGVSTRFGGQASSPTASYDRALQQTRAAERTAAELVLFPEGVGGRLAPSASPGRARHPPAPPGSQSVAAPGLKRGRARRGKHHAFPRVREKIYEKTGETGDA